LPSPAPLNRQPSAGLLELSVDTTHEAVDWVCALLAPPDLAAELTVGAPGRPDWELGVSAYLPATVGTAVVARLDDALAPLRRMGLAGELKVDELAERPPAPTPAPRRVGAHFVLLSPGAEAALGRDDLPIRVGPGPAFGSGVHPTTVCSLRLIERHARSGAPALDLGSGSGVLSVALARLGARVLAIDNDPVAVEATEMAARRNGVEGAVQAALGSLGGAARAGHWLGSAPLEPVPAIRARARFDLIAANLLARLHVGLAADYRSALRAGGRLITAGYTRDQAADVEASLAEAGMRPVDRVEEGEYFGLVHRAAA
jgi:ribosomal protein L11 methyltransferase